MVKGQNDDTLNYSSEMAWDKDATGWAHTETREIVATFGTGVNLNGEIDIFNEHMSVFLRRRAFR